MIGIKNTIHILQPQENPYGDNLNVEYSSFVHYFAAGRIKNPATLSNLDFSF
jgi:hypothetical protein